jgi:two-component system LytT family response regulator
MIQALILDDEQMNVENLDYMLTHHCREVTVAYKTLQAKDALEWLQQQSVDVVFLDIQMPFMNGFDFLKRMGKHSFQVVFVTAYDHYSLPAIKAEALDYLLKPVNLEELQHVVERLHHIKTNEQLRNMNRDMLQDFLKINSASHSLPKRIALPQVGSVIYIDVEKIIALEAQSNYTLIHKPDNQKRMVSKTLKDFEEILDENIFVRIHKSYIVNINHVKEINSIDGPSVLMNDGNSYSISRRQMDHFLDKMKLGSVTFRKN